MYQLWKHPNGTYYARYGHRLRTRASLRTKDRKEADVLYAQFVASQSGIAPEEPLVGDVLDHYLSTRTTKGRDNGEAVRAPNALKYSTKALKKHLGNLRPANLFPHVIEDYACKRGAANGTILRDIGVLRAALDLCQRSGWFDKVPGIANPVPTPKGRERWLTREEAKRLIGACVMPHLRLFVILGLMTGARSGAILELKWKQVDFAKGRVDFGTGHGNKRRAIVPMNEDLRAALTAAQTLSCTDFVVEYFGRPVGTIKNGFEAACERVKIKGVTPHILRHTCATWSVEAGVSYEEIGKMLGDTAETIERIYGHHSPDFLKRASSAVQLGLAA